VTVTAAQKCQPFSWSSAYHPHSLLWRQVEKIRARKQKPQSVIILVESGRHGTLTQRQKPQTLNSTRLFPSTEYNDKDKGLHHNGNHPQKEVTKKFSFFRQCSDPISFDVKSCCCNHQSDSIQSDSKNRRDLTGAIHVPLPQSQVEVNLRGGPEDYGLPQSIIVAMCKILSKLTRSTQIFCISNLFGSP
jgi:hypothetical protein